MNLESWAGFLFIIFLTVLLVHNRKRMQVNGLFPALYFVMYRTRLGIKAMDYLGMKWRAFFRAIAYPVIILGFLGMGLMVYELSFGLYTLITEPVAPAGVGIIQPFFPDAPGTVFVPFFYFIISVFIIATIHEFAHGVYARVWDIPVESSGFAFLGIVLPIIPAAFVEPKESVVVKRPIKEQLSMFAAGPVSNLVLGLLVLFAIGGIMAPVVSAIFDESGVEVVSYVNGNVTFPAEEHGLEIGDVIIKINDVPINSYSDFNNSLSGFLPRDPINVTTSEHTLVIPLASHEDRENGFLGVNVKPHLVTKPEFKARYGDAIPSFTKWFTGLLYWLFILNIGIGLFNLVPIGPIDGGRMLLTASKHLLGRNGERVFSYVSTFVFLLLLANIVLSIVK